MKEHWFFVAMAFAEALLCARILAVMVLETKMPMRAKWPRTDAALMHLEQSVLKRKFGFVKEQWFSVPKLELPTWNRFRKLGLTFEIRGAEAQPREVKSAAFNRPG